MNLDLISFVGIDEKTNLDQILEFDKETSIVFEYGVFYSTSRGGARYPNYEFCDQFLAWTKANDVLGSLHLCGNVINKYLESDSEVLALAAKANRIQLNLSIKDYPDIEKLAANIAEVALKNNNHIILQQNKSKEIFNMIFTSKYKDVTLSLLNDSSGGFGREITKVSAPLAHYTGYAGGIKPENVANIIKLIEDVNVGQVPYYIDMESGIRENNLFSISKCREIVKNIVNMAY